jgi:serine/threonine-protein kinase
MGGHPWPKVVDFGVSKVIAADGALASTITDAIVGTAPYMAPEQAQAGSNASFGSDQYSLAVLLYKCVTGDLPFSGRSVYETLQSMMSAPLAPPSSRVSCAQRIPPALDAAVLRAMSRNPADRFPSVRDLGAALLPLASERTRLAMGRELREQAITVSDWEAPSQVVSATVLPEGDASGSLATEQDTKALRQRRRGRAGVVGLLAVAGLLLATVAATRRDEPSAASTPPTALSAVAIATPALPAAASRAPSAAAQAALHPAAPPPVADPPPAPSKSRARPRMPTAGRVAPLPAASAVAYGENGAPILP